VGSYDLTVQKIGPSWTNIFIGSFYTSPGLI